MNNKPTFLYSPFKQLILMSLKEHGWKFEGVSKFEGAPEEQVFTSLFFTKNGKLIDELQLAIANQGPMKIRELLDARRKGLSEHSASVGAERVRAMRGLWLVDRWLSLIGGFNSSISVTSQEAKAELPNGEVTYSVLETDPAFVVAACAHWRLPDVGEGVAGQMEMATNIQLAIHRLVEQELSDFSKGLEVGRQRLNHLMTNALKTHRTVLREFNTPNYRVVVERILPTRQQVASFDGSVLAHTDGRVPPGCLAEYERQIKALLAGEVELFQFKIRLEKKDDCTDDVTHNSPMFLLTKEQIKSPRDIRRLVRPAITDVIDEHYGLSVLNKPEPVLE